MRPLFYISTIVILMACSKEELGPQCVSCEENNITNTDSTTVVIINEGNFGFGNGSITLYNDATQQVSQNVFQQQNGAPIGDVVQSISQFNNKAYVVANNSNKVEVVDITNFNALATITGFNSPRYFLPINNNKAYVTDLYSNSIQIVNLNTNTISGNINLNGWSEELILHNDTVYVCDMTNDNLLIINPTTDILVDTINLGRQPTSIVKDINDKLWILCDGGFNETNPQLIKFNPQTRSIENTFTFPNIGDTPSRLKINGSKNQLYFINNAIYQMSVFASVLPVSSLVSNNGNNFYGLGVNPNNNEIYVSDAIDFVQNGVIFRLDSTGKIIHQFQSGIIPGGFLFIK